MLRTAEGWWVATGAGATRIETTATTTGELLADRTAIDAAAAGPATRPPDSLAVLSPVTAPCRVVAQMTNFASHVRESGMNPATVPLTFFRKSSGSISGPNDDVVRPSRVRFLDYEAEIALVIGREMPVGTQVTDANLADHVAALVVTDDVSARDLQLPKTQFYESKSYPTFTPTGPALVLVDAADLRRFDDLRIRLRVNGEPRQESTVGQDMIYRPAQVLTALSRFQRLSPGDIVLTGTPGGTALTAPPRPVAMLAGLLPPATRWKLFFRSQGANPRYLDDGDVIEIRIATDDGALDLGTQRTAVRWTA